MKLFYKRLRLNLIKEKEMFFEKMKKISHQGTKILLCGVAPLRSTSRKDRDFFVKNPWCFLVSSSLGGKKVYGGLK